jgi:hypothetical protein
VVSRQQRDKPRQRSQASATLASLALVAAAPVHAAELPSLLARVGLSVEKADHAMRTLDYVERSVDEQRNETGKALHRVEKERRVIQSSGKRRQEIVSVVQDGHDLTAPARLAALGQAMDDEAGPNPLMPGEQTKYLFTSLPADAADPGWVHVAFKPKDPRAGDLLVGEAWIDPSTGFLRRLRFQPADPTSPQKMDVTVDYAQLALGCALQSKMEATLEPRVEPVRQRLHSQVTYHFDVKRP